MSYLQNQISSFRSDVTSSSSKISNKRTIAAPTTSAPSPAPSSSNGSAMKSELKRKRPEASKIVYSQPKNTGMGNNVMTQVTYAVEYLKSKETPQTLDSVFGYLSLHNQPEHDKTLIATILRKHEKVDYDRTGAGGKGTFRFRPIHNIRSGDQLLGYLQNQPSAQGLSVRELKDGWQGAEKAIDELQVEEKLLVTRNKKDEHAKMVWANDPSLSQHVDEEFKKIWGGVRLPEAHDLTVELEKAGLTPTSKEIHAAKPKEDKKKRKAPRKGGRTTNHHMDGILRDYSNLKK
ncbi:MAG: hypothetical protein M1827_003175 [Pycnora praestabilis]|nr:MAG: hypothetical protein M1827_003175 [Pycnora praestabilis]